ncbi:protein NATD1 [Arctopsyche grandis]|uniref:protein NATD1 n=1 Tax=Arctopsyche grandis TaxID=121162 RepID=UPI00406D8032
MSVRSVSLLCRQINNNCNLRMITRSQIKSFSSKELQVNHVKDKNHFAVELNGEYATLEYSSKNNMITFLHTEVPEVFRGKGVGKILAEEALQYATKNNLKIKIECDFVQKYYSENKSKFK